MKNHYIILPLIAATLFAPAALAADNGANFYIAMPNAALNPGSQLIANIKIDTGSAGINAAQATIQFPKDILAIEKTDKTGSIFSFWLREPDYSNDTGILVFIGGIDKSISGKDLQVLKIVFKVKGAGEGDILFNDAAITASDGTGTNILATISGTQIVSTPQQTIAQTVKVASPVAKAEPAKTIANQAPEPVAVAENTVPQEKSLISSIVNFLPQSPVALASILGMFAGLLLGYVFGKNFTISRKR